VLPRRGQCERGDLPVQATDRHQAVPSDAARNCGWCSSQARRTPSGRCSSGQAYRYVWPSELDLMAKITASGSGTRWSGWDRAPFTPAAKARSRCSRDCHGRLHAQIYQIWPPELISARMLMAVQIGGYRTRRERLLVTACNLTPVSG
jgi:hypothetical protein